MTPEERISKSYGCLPMPPVPVANFVPVTQSGNTIYLSGQGPILDGQAKYLGKLGAECDVQMGYDAAAICGMNLLAHLKKYLGDLSRVKQILKATVFVASAPDFFDQPKVANGFSDLMADIFGEKGKHTRSAVGIAVLPGNIPVEIELVVEIEK